MDVEAQEEGVVAKILVCSILVAERLNAARSPISAIVSDKRVHVISLGWRRLKERTCRISYCCCSRGRRRDQRCRCRKGHQGCREGGTQV